MCKTTFYHGSTTALNLKIGDYLEPPIMTGVLREDWRKKHLDSVYFTNSILSATKFAKKAAQKYGGEPVIFIVKPRCPYYNINTNEYISTTAKIIGVYKDK